ncbi:integrator complex subunit 6 isoform X2 [Bemisia tabaci]|uniref:integrator complex subunit 6 isoform X2 n=1 Tax=Bemisia tabaci TaxID=7038 RepID=UPI0008F9885C|nr:PREDICTED: integrator complex subunit 6 isoform X2 [Bemisia tabaci]
MTIIVFLIDTSASMNQRAFSSGHPTLLDVAKTAVETFVKVRQRSPESRGDRYMLLTFEEPPANIKAGWKENLTTFMTELKNLQCCDMTLMGAALRHAFDVLNINRMQTGIDTYGQGRSPFFLEPALIVVITDGGKLSNSSGVQEEITLPMNAPIPGSEMTREPFRWDQRLFSLVLRLTGTPAVDRDTGLVPSDSSPIDAMCEVTGGRSYCITSHRMLMQCIDSLVAKVQSGVVINFEKMGPDPPPLPNEIKSEKPDIDGDIEMEWDSKDGLNIINHADKININQNGARPGNNGTNMSPALGVTLNNTAWHSCRKLIYVPRSGQKAFAVGYWPIPEAFWPDPTASSLPPRSAHPNVKFTCTSHEPMVIENLPFDKYELEPCPLTQYMLARKQPTVCWQVFIPSSHKNSEAAHPFGYLKSSTNLSCVNLFVMPYNYPVILPLLDELFKVHRFKYTPEWRTAFQKYINSMPCYYAAPLRRALTRMGAPPALAQSLIPDSAENSLSFSILNYLKRLKNQAKTEFDRLCNDVSNRLSSNNKPIAGPALEGIRVTQRSHLKRDLISHPALLDNFSAMRDQLNDFGGFVVNVSRNRLQNRRAGRQSYRNPFDIPRPTLLDQVFRMRSNFLQSALNRTKLIDDDHVHSMPVSQMGNYQEYLKRMQPQLREVESTPVRQHMFGNPFKIDKRMMMVDEADIDLVGGGGSSPAKGGTKRGASENVAPTRPPPSKRKAGPIPRHVTFRRSPSVTSSSCGDSPPPTPPPTPPPIMPVMPLVNGDLDSLSRSLKRERPGSRSPSPPLADVPPPILQPYDGSLASSESNQRSVLPSPDPVPPKLEELETPFKEFNDYSPAYTNSNHNYNPPPPPPPLPPNCKADSIIDSAQVKKHNMNLRALAFKEIKKPGRNYEALFRHVKSLKGSPQIQAQTIQDIIEESLRFKRQHLASVLDNHMQEILGMEKFQLMDNGAR